jgi:hypothetical protein
MIVLRHGLFCTTLKVIVNMDPELRKKTNENVFFLKKKKKKKAKKMPSRFHLVSIFMLFVLLA